MVPSRSPSQTESPSASSAIESASERRVSPYPLRKRTSPPRAPSAEASRPCQRPRTSPGSTPLALEASSSTPITHHTPRTSLHSRTQSRTASPLTSPGCQPSQSPSDSTLSSVPHQRRQLVVQPIIKDDVTQREASEETLEDFVANGSSFKVILEKLWQKFSGQIKGLTVKWDGSWTLDDPPPSTAWSKVMQFKMDRHLVSSITSDVAWNRWVTARRGETVKLLIYKYGMAIVKTKDLTDFRVDCIHPPAVDRSGATAESGLRDVVAQLQDVSGETFQAHGTVWRMWGNEITRSLDRLTWGTAIMNPPPDHVMRLLKPADIQVDRQLSGLTRSAQLALDCVHASIADNVQLKQDVNALLQRVVTQASGLATRKSIIEALLADIPPVSADEVTDPLERLENINDDEHQE